MSAEPVVVPLPFGLTATYYFRELPKPTKPPKRQRDVQDEAIREAMPGLTDEEYAAMRAPRDDGCPF